MGLTADIGRFVSGIAATPLPVGATAIVATGFVDCVGMMVAGWNEGAPRVARASVGVDDMRDAPWPGNVLTASAPDRALVFGTAAHVLDYDDTGLHGHPSAVLAPAILAEAQETGGDGVAMIAAYVAGYEVWAELIFRDQDPHHGKGWHPSATFGTLAAAAASAVLRGLDAEQAARAICIACSFAGGVTANFGSMTKSFQVGRAAQSGLLATRLAVQGLTAAQDAVEHEGGLLRALSPRGQVDVTSPARLGRDWRIAHHGLNIKLYPVCFSSHRALNAMHDLCVDHDLAADDIEAVAVEIGATQLGMMRHHRPRTALDAKFSLEFAMAAMALRRRCGLDELDDAFVASAAVQRFLPRVTAVPLHEVDPDETAHSPFDRVTIALRDGGLLASPPVTHPLGHFRRPVAPAQLRDKFLGATAATLGAPAAEALFERLAQLARLRSVADLWPAATETA
jgi:2-methylcitrate dehydratase PrpD